MEPNKKPTYQDLVKSIDELQSELKRVKSNDKDSVIQDYKRLFDDATISIWNEDFTEVFEEIDQLRKLNISNIIQHLEEHPEVLLSILQKLKVNSVNKATLNLFEAENDEVFLNKMQDTFGEGANKVFINIIDSIWKYKKSFTSEVNYRTLTGSEFAALFSFPIPQSKLEQKSVPVTIQSIQALKDAESAKREYLIKLEQAQKIGKIGSWEWNSETDKALWSDEMYRIYGVQKDEFDPTSINVSNTILEEDKHKMENAIEDLLKGKVVAPFEFKIQRPNNEVRDLNVIALQVNKETIFGVTQDVTDRKKIENKLNEAQTLAKVGSWLFYPATQKLEWSDETFHLLGFDPKKDEPDNAAFVKRIHEDDLSLFNSVVDKAIRLGTPYDIEHKVCLPNGDQKVLRAICKPVLGVNGEVVSLVGTSQDITSHKLFEQNQVKYQRLKAMGEMSSSIAHDFNNSLQEIMGNLEIVKLQNDFSESTLSRLENIGAIINDVAERVSALQKFGDSEHHNKDTKILDLNVLIKDSLNQTRPLWKDAIEKEGGKITIKTNFEELPKINGNSGELKSVIYNVVKNSIEAMPDGGNLLIKTGTKDESIFATFTDSGIGMDEETILKIFDPFYTTKGFELGRGLGMSGVYTIVKKHGGEITVKNSQLNQGTTIEIVFPFSQQHEIKIINEIAPKTQKSLNVLWVDDDFLITASSRLMVESLGHQCKAFNRGQKALKYLNDNPCDIVFTDIGMPVMNGWELADAIRSKFGNKIKIVVVTGWDVDIKVKEKHGIDFILQKPFSMEKLKKAFLDV